MLTVKVTITDEDGNDYSLADVIKLAKAVEKLNADEKEVARKETATLFPARELAPFPLRGGGVYELDEITLNRWKEVYIGVDVVGELRSAREWLLSKKSRLKTVRGMPTCLTGWLNRAVQQAREENGYKYMPEPQKGRKLTPDKCRYYLVKQGLEEARDWTDERCMDKFLELEEAGS